MKTIISAHRKGLALALFVLAAGLCYSCGPGREPEAVFLSSGEAAGEAAGGVSALGGQKSEAFSSEKNAGSASALGAGLGDVAPEVLSAPEQDQGREGGDCYVHVCGEVVHPGVYRLAEGQRVFEAVELAGGFTDMAADAFLNLAEPVFDGMKVEVPDRERASEMIAGQEASGQGLAVGQDAGKINLNTATREELMTLRGIGQARAEDILAYRKQHGGFGRIEEIMEVPGIKEAAFQKIRDDITV